LTVVLVTCSGISNTGRLTTEAALTLMHRKPGRFVWMHAQRSAESFEDEVGDAEEVIVIDGCKDCCAKKKLSASRIAPHRHIITTEIGITKNGMAEVQFHEIEKVIDAIMDDGGGPV
jgi:uncharacterized metal-binding protein